MVLQERWVKLAVAAAAVVPAAVRTAWLSFVSIAIRDAVAAVVAAVVLVAPAVLAGLAVVLPSGC